MKTKNEQLCTLLDAVFDGYPERPDFSAVRELAYTCSDPSWLITELLKVLWLYNEDPSAFDEYIWEMVDSMD